MAEKIPYFSPTGLFGRWQLHEGVQGCKRIEAAGAVLHTERAAPGNSGSIASSGRSKIPSKEQVPFKMLTDLVAAGRYLTTPPPKPPSQIKTPPPAKYSANSQALEAWPIFKFDIQDIPPAMDKIGWPNSAALMREFFAGRLNFSNDLDDERDGIDQQGNYYPPEFVDTKRFTWKWLLEYGAVAEAFKQLIKPGYIDSSQGADSARTAMGRKVMNAVNTKYATFMGEIDTLAECKGDVFALHRNYQFQRKGLSIYSFTNTDLAGSMGNFSLYAAVAYATVKRQDYSPHTVTVTHVYVYAKDNYSFNDPSDGPSQYLGHWNKQGVIFVPAQIALDRITARIMQGFGHHGPEFNIPIVRTDPSNPWFDGADFTVQTGEHYKEENVFFPVRNRNLRNWQQTKQRGGNILIFSELKLLRLERPVSFTISNP